MATTIAQVTPGIDNPYISAQTVRNRLREAGLSTCRPVLTRHHRQQHRLWAQTHCCWTRQDWQKVLFTESGFCLTRGDGQIHVYRQRNECYTEACTLERDRFLEVEDPSWSGAVCHSINGLSLLSLQAISTLCVIGKTSSSLMWYPSCRLILT